MEYVLYTTYYLATDNRRNEENAICLQKNMANELISKIYLVLQNDDVPILETNSKVEFIKLGKRPTFADFFNHANLNEESKGKRRIIANSDIYFTSSLSYLDSFSLRNKVVTLTRWDLKSNDDIVFYNKYLSQDVWIFDDLIPSSIGNYFIGQHGCDNRLLHEISNAGFEIINPSLVIKSIHVHMSDSRPYFNDPNYKFVEGDYRYSYPSGLHKPIKLLLFKLFSKTKYNKYKFCFKDYFYIRFELNYRKFRNEVQHMNYHFPQRIIAIFPLLYYYVFFKLSKY